MFFMHVKSKKKIKSIKNTKREDVKQANKNKNDNYAHKTSKKKKITMRIKTSKRKKITCLTFYAFYSFCAFYSFYTFYSFYACEITLITSFTILLPVNYVKGSQQIYMCLKWHPGNCPWRNLCLKRKAGKWYRFSLPRSGKWSVRLIKKDVSHPDTKWVS